MTHPAKKPAKRHAPVQGLESRLGVLHLNGHSALDLAASAGRPVFVYNSAVIDETIASLRSCLPPNVALHYAVKANPYAPVISHIAPQVDGLDVASSGEITAIHAATARALPISFAGPGKRDAELAAAIDMDVCVNLESETEMQRLSAIATDKGVVAKAAVRINPPFDLRGSGMRMGGGAKPFGIDHDVVPRLLSHWREETLDFQGFHIFTGSQSLSSDALIDAHQQALQLGLDMVEHAPKAPTFINIGGGLGVPYFPGDNPVDVKAVGDGLRASLDEASPRLGATKVVLELGRYLVGEAGTYLTPIIDRKQSRGSTFLITEGGLNHQLAVSGNFGQAFRKNYPVAIAGKFGFDDTPSQERVNVVGCLCTPLDRLADAVSLPRAEVGDIFAVFRCGAYGPTASPSGFLSHPAAAEVLV